MSRYEKNAEVAVRIQDIMDPSGKTLLEFVTNLEAFMIDAGKRRFGDPKQEEWLDALYKDAVEYDEATERMVDENRWNA